MDAASFVNLFCYLLIGVLCFALCRRRLWVPAIALGSLAVHGLIFHGVYIHRALYWETCPPMCGLQEWSPVIRLHGLLAILTAMTGRITLGGRGG